MKINNIAKNTSLFTFALILQKVISFTYFTVLARNLGPEDLGKYYLALSLTTIFAIFIDIGMMNVLMREVAKRQKEASSLLASVMVIKLPLMFLAFISVIATAHLLNYPVLTRQLVYLASIAMILDSFTMTFYSTIRGFHNLRFESFGLVMYQLIMLAMGLTFMKLGMSLRWIMLALVMASIANFLYALMLATGKFKLKLIAPIDKAMIRSIILITIPFGLFGIFQRLYLYLDSILLSSLAGDYYVGLYQISFKIIFALQFLPMAFIASLYPAFSTYWKSNKDQLTITFERAMSYLIIISVPISVGVIAISDKIILLFKPEYISAVLPLQIIMLAIFFIFINFPIGSLLNACDRQKINTFNMAITLIVSIGMNLILIPFYKALGASITVVATNALMFFLGIRQVPKIIDYSFSKLAICFTKVLAAAVIMGMMTVFLKQFLHIFAVVGLAGVVYLGCLYLFKAVKREDLRSVVGSFLKN